MKPRSHLFIVLFFVFAFAAIANAQDVKRDVPYANLADERQVLDVYTPENRSAKNLRVVLWIHGGGWQMGDKTDVQIKPWVFTQRGFVFVSTNYRLLPDVEMDVLIRDVAGLGSQKYR